MVATLVQSEDQEWFADELAAVAAELAEEDW